MVNICLLGCGGNVPTIERSLTSLLIAYNGKKILIDCGEGTQVSMKMVGWGFKNIDIICFTHFHADHIAGLPGLLLTIANSGRTEPIKIIGPEGLKKVIKGLRVIAPELPYIVEIYELKKFENAIENNDLIINTMYVNHTLPCISYSVEIKRKRKFDKDKAEKNNVPMKLWSRLQNGETILYNGICYNYDMVLGEERKGIKICYCTDTRPNNEISKFIKGADIFICEGMYGDDDDIEKAIQNKHMLFSEAAKLAKEGAVKEMWLTHYSPSLTEPEKYLEVTKEIFKNTYIGEDRKIKELKFE